MEIDSGIQPEQTRLRMTIVPQKTDNSKIYIVGLADHGVTDGLSLIQSIGMLQENWRDLPVPWPKHTEHLSTL